MKIRLGALGIDQHASGVVVEKKWHMQAFVGDFYPLPVLALLLQLPCRGMEVVAGDAGDGRNYGVGTGSETIDFNQAHGGTADLGSGCVKDQTLALQKAETAVKQV